MYKDLMNEYGFNKFVARKISKHVNELAETGRTEVRHDYDHMVDPLRHVIADLGAYTRVRKTSVNADPGFFNYVITLRKVGLGH
jgi:hypothetical protein